MKRIFKKIVCLLLAVCCVGGMAACNTHVDDPEAVYLAIQVQGYGSRWLKDLAALYEEKTGIHAEVVDEYAVEGQTTSEFNRGPRNNNVDIYFSIVDSNFSLINTGVLNSNAYGFVDLTDVYEAKPEGYGDEYESIRDLVYDYAYDTILYDGTPYMFSWALGMEGLLYHEKMFEEYGYRVPRTTDELIEIFNDFTEKTKPASGNRADRTLFATTWYEGYWLGRMLEWWIQYEGLDTYYAFTEGQDLNGNYTADVYAQIGRLRAFEVLYDLLNYNSENSDPGSISEPYTRTQMKFLQNRALITPNGDWLEREMETSIAEIEDTVDGYERDFKFMRTPIISAITEKFTNPEVWDDQKLRQAISWLDGEDGATRPAELTDGDMQKLQEAMSIVEVQGQRQTAFIPSYSNNIDGAKEFIKFLYSKEAQMTMYETLQGNTFPLKYDFSQEEGANPSVFVSSKFNLLKEDTVLIGNDFSNRMFYLGGMRYMPDAAIPFASQPGTSSYLTASALYQNNYNDYSSRWSDIRSAAGV